MPMSASLALTLTHADVCQVRHTAGGGEDVKLVAGDLAGHARRHLIRLEGLDHSEGPLKISPLREAGGGGEKRPLDDGRPSSSHIPEMMGLGEGAGRRWKEGKEEVKARRRAEKVVAGLLGKGGIARAYLVAMPFMVIRRFSTSYMAGDDDDLQKLQQDFTAQKRQLQLLQEAFANIAAGDHDDKAALLLFSTVDELYDVVPLAALRLAQKR
jgi:hypothetical protein